MDSIGKLEEQVRLVKKDDELIQAILKKRELSPDLVLDIQNMLRYNVLTLKQVSELTGLAISTLQNRLRPIYREGKLTTDLDCTYPFQTLTESGPKFIVRNEKFDAFLKNYI